MEIARDVAAVVFVLALLFGVRWALRRAGATKIRTRERKLETIDRIALTPQHALHLIRFNHRDLLVSTHPQGCSLLADPCPSACIRGQNSESVPSGVEA